MNKDFARDTQVCNNCGYVVLGSSHKIKRCVACDGQGEMIIDNKTDLGTLLDQMEELSYRRSSVAEV